MQVSTQTVTASLIGSIARMAEHANADQGEAINKVLFDVVGPGGELPVHYQLALLAINDLDDLHTKVQEIYLKRAA